MNSMKEITKELLQDCAHRLLFDMTDEQYELLQKEFDTILRQMELLGDESLDEYSPMVFPFDVTVDYLRDDSVVETISTSEALSNAKDVVENQIRLPKVVL